MKEEAHLAQPPSRLEWLNELMAIDEAVKRRFASSRDDEDHDGLDWMLETDLVAEHTSSTWPLIPGKHKSPFA